MAGPPLGSSALKAPAEFPWPYAHLSVEGFVMEVLEMGELHTHTRVRHACTCTHAHTHRRAHAPAALVPELQALGGPARLGKGCRTALLPTAVRTQRPQEPLGGGRVSSCLALCTECGANTRNVDLRCGGRSGKGATCPRRRGLSPLPCSRRLCVGRL